MSWQRRKMRKTKLLSFRTSAMITNIFFLGMVYLNKKRKLCSTYNIPWYIFCIYYLHVFLLIKDYHTQILCSPTFKGVLQDRNIDGLSLGSVVVRPLEHLQVSTRKWLQYPCKCSVPFIIYKYSAILTSDW